MTNKKNKTIRIFAWFGAIVFAIVLAVMPFLVNIRDKNITYADDVTDTTFTEFNSSNIFIPSAIYSDDTGGIEGNSNFLRNTILNFKFRFYFDYTTLNDWVLSVSATEFNQNVMSSFGRSDIYGSRWRNHYWASYQIGNLSWNYYDVWCDYDSGITANFYKFDIYCHKWGDVNTNVMETKLTFYDNTDKRLVIGFYTLVNYDSSYNHFKLSNRTYLFSTSLNDNQYYLQGFSDGYNDGYFAGDSAGYQSGYNAGYSVGERTGFNDGVVSANDYSFLGLFGAIVDAPLSAFTGLFDFNLSFDGVHNFNLKGFFLAMLTIAIVIAIIRFALKR